MAKNNGQSSKFYIPKDINGVPAFVLPQPTITNNWNTTLSENTAQSIEVPPNIYKGMAFFFPQIGADIWMAYNETATLPGGSFSSNGSQYCVPGWTLNTSAGDYISFITANTTATIGVIFFDGYR